MLINEQLPIETDYLLKQDHTLGDFQQLLYPQGSTSILNLTDASGYGLSWKSP